MSLYYPQGAMTFKIRWEDFGKTGNPVLNEVYTLRVLARNLVVEINDYNEADTFNCEIDYKSFPFDPRTLRSIGVTIHIQDKTKIFTGSKLNLIEPTVDNTIFTGFVDESNIEFDDTSRIVRLEGRDFTGLFADQKRLINEPIPLSLPIDKIIENLIAEQEATKTIAVEVRLEGVLPTLSKLAPDFDPVTAVKNVKRNETYWDIMQSIVAKAGLIGFIEKDKYIITKPQTLFNREKTKQFIYGKNIKRLSYRRKLGRQRNFNIKVVSLNLEKKKTIEAKIPKESKPFLEDGVTKNPFFIRFGGENITIPQLDKEGNKIDPPKDAPFLTFRIADIASKEHLISVGEKIFEELSRQELEGSLMTFEMEIPEQIENKDKNKTNPVKFSTIRTGTPIQIIMDQDDLDQIKTIATVKQIKKFLILRGYEARVAEAFAQSMNRVSSPFFTKTVKFTISQTEGFQMDLDFINFIELDNQNLSF